MNEVQEKPTSGNYRTETGTRFQNTITWELNEDVTEDSGEKSYEYWSESLTGAIPNREDLAQLMKATYSVGARLILGDLINLKSC